MDGPIVKMLMKGGVGWTETEQNLPVSGEPGWHYIDITRHLPGDRDSAGELQDAAGHCGGGPPRKAAPDLSLGIPRHGKLTSSFCE